MIRELDHYWNVKQQPTLHRYVEPSPSNFVAIKHGFIISIVATAMVFVLGVIL